MGSNLNPLSAILSPILSLVSGNAQEKAAEKNNQNQQDSEVQNALLASKQAQDLYHTYASAHQSPFTGAHVNGPTPQPPVQNGMVQRILQATRGGPPVPPTPYPLPTPQSGVVNAILGQSR